MSGKIRFAIIGASGIAESHIKAIRNCSNAEGRYIFSRDSKRAKEFSDRFGLIAAQSYEEILNSNRVDAVLIVTEPHRHAKLALEALKNHKHVLVEKPLDVNISLAKEFVEASEKSPVVSSVISQNRFDPIIKKMKEKMENGLIGEPYLAEIKLLWKRTNDYYNVRDGWRGRYGNVLINQAIHYIDLAVWFFGLPVEIQSFITKVNDNIECYDTALVSFRFHDNILFNLTCSTACSESEPVRFSIYGTEGQLDYNLEKQLYLENRSRKKRVGHFFKTITKNSDTNKKYSLFYYQLDDFVNAIRDSRCPKVTVREAFNILKIIESCENQNGFLLKNEEEMNTSDQTVVPGITVAENYAARAN